MIQKIKTQNDLEKAIKLVLEFIHNDNNPMEVKNLFELEKDYSLTLKTIFENKYINGILRSTNLEDKYEQFVLINPSLTAKGVKFMSSGKFETSQPINNFNISGNISGSMIGTQNNSVINNTYSWSDLENRIDKECDQEDKDIMKELLLLLKDAIENEKPLKRGMLTKFSDKLNKYGWFFGAVTSCLLNFLTN